ncbi:uncharacterized protein LOC122980418 isoform X3 [Thunnus albacares]|uniref:uncharacterized protein LOC122980418 isoform X3 n=1 Tax=Thunnus albacares TaxID=8236 RepID=UPI001CF6E566|nr:uncharacterized protein LOC122980418 isoform X3 [Thunnus albacares]
MESLCCPACSRAVGRPTDAWPVPVPEPSAAPANTQLVPELQQSPVLVELKQSHVPAEMQQSPVPVLYRLTCLSPSRWTPVLYSSRRSLFLHSSRLVDIQIDSVHLSYLLVALQSDSARLSCILFSLPSDSQAKASASVSQLPAQASPASFAKGQLTPFHHYHHCRLQREVP